MNAGPRGRPAETAGAADDPAITSEDVREEEEMRTVGPMYNE